MTYFFETYGCQMNSAESAAMELVLAGRGWNKAVSGEEADLVLLNTCSVRETAETRLRGRLAQYAALKKKRSAAGETFTLTVAGCMAERLGEKLKADFPAVDYVMGTSARQLFPAILETAEKGLLPEQGFSVEQVPGEKPVFAFSASHLEPGAFRSFVPIMHGCDNFCSYCIVPYVRGREVSRSPDSIAGEIALLAGQGVKEITLLGQNVNSYRWDSGAEARALSVRSGASDAPELDFPALLELAAGWIAGTSIKWIRFLSANPKDFSDKTIAVMASHRCFCRHVHLPVQHGSNRILAAMNRRYTREAYLELAGRLRAAMPDISLSTDIMVGFPGETGDDVEETLDLMNRVRFSYAYMYHYNPREGTAAAELPGRINYKTKIERLSRVIALQKAHRIELLKSRIGGREQVLVEGISRKNADEYITRTERDDTAVVTGGAEPGSFAWARLRSLNGTTFRAELEV
ncbi:MAG: tRNA (N6-isopentenyl adenosine(37)-C2)-methylthiotransferase MiaB [Treponema sp.]|nr:tRNA (N6-isopentenyl adenosine(37)-C2)-methylthiotransferase MiaB [Treponema sp.]